MKTEDKCTANNAIGMLIVHGETGEQFFIASSKPPKVVPNPAYISKSLNPSDAQIRAWEVEETLRRTRKTTGELFPNAGDLHSYLSKPVNKIKYYQIARCRVKYKTA